MSGRGEEQRETIRPEFNSAIMIDFQGAKITSDRGFLLLRVSLRSSGTTGNSSRGLGSSLPIPSSPPGKWSMCTTGVATLRIGSKKERTRSGGTGRVAIVLSQSRPVTHGSFAL